MCIVVFSRTDHTHGSSLVWASANFCFVIWLQTTSWMNRQWWSLLVMVNNQIEPLLFLCRRRRLRETLLRTYVDLYDKFDVAPFSQFFTKVGHLFAATLHMILKGRFHLFSNPSNDIERKIPKDGHIRKEIEKKAKDNRKWWPLNHGVWRQPRFLKKNDSKYWPL